MFTITLHFVEKDVASLLYSAFESSCGAGYWCRIAEEVATGAEVLNDSGQSIDDMDYIEKLVAGYTNFVLEDMEDEDKRHTLDRKKLEKGLACMAKKYPKAFSDFISENADATTGDVFLQCCLFNDVLYG